MAYYRFTDNDVFHSSIRAYPKVEFLIYSGTVFYNNRGADKGASQANTGHVGVGGINLYELNVDRTLDSTHHLGSSNLIKPFLSKGSDLSAFKTVSMDTFDCAYSYGDKIWGKYPLTSSITADQYFTRVTAGVIDDNTTTAQAEIIIKQRRRLYALKSTMAHYKTLNVDYGNDNYYTEPLTLISIPSIFYGSTIKKGSVKMRFYTSGSLLSEVTDERYNGALIQNGHGSATNGSGSTAGMVLYNEGFVVMTGSWSLDDNHKEKYDPSQAVDVPRWKYFATTGSSAATKVPISSFELSFEGTTHTPTMTMMAHALKGHLNNSVNPTFIRTSQSGSHCAASTGSIYMESDKIEIKNIVSSSYDVPSASFSKETYISSIGIYDKDKNLIGVAKLARPVRKTEERDFTFKMKLDF